MEDPFGNIYADVYYDPDDPLNVETFRNRMLFLMAAAHYIPGLAESLFRRCVPVVAETIKRHGALPYEGSPGYKEYCFEYDSALREWAKGYHIEVPWIIGEASQIVFSGILYAQKGIDPVKAFGTWRRKMLPRMDTRQFVLPAWDTAAESENSYIQRVNNAWAKSRAEYVAETKRALESKGFRKVPRRRKRQYTDKHLEWAVLRQCAGRSVEELADQFGEGTEIIRTTTRRILEPLGLEPPT